VSRVIEFTDEDIAALTSLIARSDPRGENYWLREAFRKLNGEPSEAIPGATQGAWRGKYGWKRLFHEKSPVTFPPPEGVSLDTMTSRAHAWASGRGVRIVTRQIGGKLHVWLVGKAP